MKIVLLFALTRIVYVFHWIYILSGEMAWECQTKDIRIGWGHLWIFTMLSEKQISSSWQMWVTRESHPPSAPEWYVTCDWEWGESAFKTDSLGHKFLMLVLNLPQSENEKIQVYICYSNANVSTEEMETKIEIASWIPL